MDQPVTDRPLTAIVINRHSGTVRSMGEEKVRALVTAAVPGGEDSIALLDGTEIETHIGDLVRERRISRLYVGGGDGTVASAAGFVSGTGIALGILPLGTMNMMAQTLGISLDLATALEQLRDAEELDVDAGRAAGRLFLHHVAFGLQPRMVRIRERLGYSSRLTKMLAGVRAVAAVLLNRQSMRLTLRIDGSETEMKTPALAVSNNLYADTMMLKQARLDEGILGIYALRPMPLVAFLGLAIDLLRGRWRDNLNLREMRAPRLRIVRRRLFGGHSRSIRATLDGELMLFDLPLTIESAPKAVRMLVPRAPG